MNTNKAGVTVGVLLVSLAIGSVYAAYNHAHAASFYRAYCKYENKWLGQWHNDATVAKNTRNFHKRYNASHAVSIRYK